MTSVGYERRIQPKIPMEPQTRLLFFPVSSPKIGNAPVRRLPSRVSRRGLPCPEAYDTYEPKDERDMNGFISVTKTAKWKGRGLDEEEEE